MLLLDANLRHLLLDFAERPMSIKEASEVADLDLGRTYYRAMKLLNAELLEIASIEPRKGREIKRYRAVATKFVVRKVTMEMPEKSTIDEIIRAIEQLDSDIVISIDDYGRRSIAPMEKSRFSDTSRVCTELNLSQKDRSAFEEDLRRLVSKYQDNKRRGADRTASFLLWAGIARGKLRGH